MSNWNTATCAANGINIHYIRTGEGKPSLIFLHGLMTNGACWTPVAHILAEKYDVIMTDARGHGKSSVPDFGYRYEDHADDVVGLINVLGLTSPIVIGHSMGGMTAAVVASRNPRLLGGLILVDPSFLSLEVQRQVRDSDVADQHRRLLTRTLTELVADAQIKQPHRSLRMIELIALARMQTSMAAFDVLTPPNPEFMQLINTIDIPSLLVIGDAGVVSLALAEELQRLNSKLQVHIIENAGHGLPYDQPEKLALVVLDFLTSPADTWVKLH